MTAPNIDSSTREERLDYVLNEWKCLHNCEPMEQREQKPNLFGLCRVASDEGEANDSGVSWIVETEGKTLFHAGDLCRMFVPMHAELYNSMPLELRFAAQEYIKYKDVDLTFSNTKKSGP